MLENSEAILKVTPRLYYGHFEMASYSGSAPPLALGQAICFSFARQSGTDLSSFSWTYECSFLSVVRFGAKHQGTSALLNHPIDINTLLFLPVAETPKGKIGSLAKTPRILLVMSQSIELFLIIFCSVIRPAGSILALRLIRDRYSRALTPLAS
jgi:hypothetical protein